MIRLRAHRPPPTKIRVHLLVRGRIGEGWQDVDRTFRLPPGATLNDLLEAAESRGVELRRMIRMSPHLAETLMIDGERCPVEENLSYPLRDGSEVYLLAPLAGG